MRPEGEAGLIVIDSAVWIAWFNGRSGPHVDRLEAALLRNEEILTAPVIIAEVLEGFSDDRDFELARGVLTGLRSVALDVDGHVQSARLYRSLRKRGITIRGVVDCIIAQTCLSEGAEILTPDRDFAAIAKHTALRLCAV